MTTDLVAGELQDFWDISRPNALCPALRDALRSRSPILSLGAGPNDHAEALEILTAHRGPTDILHAFKNWPQLPLCESLLSIVTRFGGLVAAVRRLIIATRAGTVERLYQFRDPLARHLAAIHGRDLSPVDEGKAARFLAGWIWSRATLWEASQLELFGLTTKMIEAEGEGPDNSRAQRLFRFLFLAQVYGLFERAVIVVNNLESLIRLPQPTSEGRRNEARKLDTLLASLAKWDESGAVKVFLGWSGREEDAVLLRGLHAPLFEKVHASQVRLGHA